jgi:hypothetical protein
MDVRKVFVSHQGEALVICEVCGKSKKIKVRDTVIEQYKPVKIKCSCGVDFLVLFEKRKYYRKSVGFIGNIRPADETDKRDSLVFIVDLSQRGLRFRSSSDLDLKVGEVVIVRFVLEGTTKVPIQSTAVVKNIMSRHVGVEFLDLSEFIKKQIGYFLMP